MKAINTVTSPHEIMMRGDPSARTPSLSTINAPGDFQQEVVLRKKMPRSHAPPRDR